jgi:polyphosphate kinase
MKKNNKTIDLNDPKLYENRELSWLEFNQRVLWEAENPENPLFERVKFLAIVSSNLDEFFMVRVASLMEQIHAGYDRPDFSGLSPKDQIEEISIRAHRMVEDQGNVFKRSLLQGLKKENIIFTLDFAQLNEHQIDYIDQYFENNMYPILTPMAVDSSRPFPLILNKSLNIAVILQKEGQEFFATVQVPAMIHRYLEIPAVNEGERQFVMLKDIIVHHIAKLFMGYEVLCASPYRITRNADLTIDEEEAEDLLLEIEKSIKKRKWGEAIRLEIDQKVDERILIFLKDALKLKNRSIYKINGPIDLTFLMKVYGMSNTKSLKFNDYSPKRPKDLLGEEDIFEAIKKKDIFLNHPFESFEPVVEWIQDAAKDPLVLAIKQTLYRVSGRSPIIQALAEAAEAGKQVTVLVELKARFDEENNIQWARRLEKAGCHVIYGLVGLKTHSKVTLIVRKEDEGIRRYVHLGTGNYNDITARFYTDMGLLTVNEQVGRDVSAIFNTLSGYSEPPKLHKITMAPTQLRDRFIYMIRREAEYAREGKKAQIICKMNSLCDFEVMQELYKASMEGVEIELIVRGICCLIPGIEGVSENITVRSIVGKYLEHSRIFYFYNNGKENLYLSSADWMPRNLNRRVELLFPLEAEHIKTRVMGMIDILLKDVVKAKIKDADKNYNRIDRRGKEVINSQDYFEEQANIFEKKYYKEEIEEIFVPIMSHEPDEMS